MVNYRKIWAIPEERLYEETLENKGKSKKNTQINSYSKLLSATGVLDTLYVEILVFHSFLIIYLVLT